MLFVDHSYIKISSPQSQPGLRKALEMPAVTRCDETITNMLVEHGARVKDSIALHSVISQHKSCIAMTEHLVKSRADTAVSCCPSLLHIGD